MGTRRPSRQARRIRGQAAAAAASHEQRGLGEAGQGQPVGSGLAPRVSPRRRDERARPTEGADGDEFGTSRPNGRFGGGGGGAGSGPVPVGPAGRAARRAAAAGAAVRARARPASRAARAATAAKCQVIIAVLDELTCRPSTSSPRTAPGRNPQAAVGEGDRRRRRRGGSARGREGMAASRTGGGGGAGGGRSGGDFKASDLPAAVPRCEGRQAAKDGRRASATLDVNGGDGGVGGVMVRCHSPDRRCSATLGGGGGARKRRASGRRRQICSAAARGGSTRRRGAIQTSGASSVGGPGGAWARRSAPATAGVGGAALRRNLNEIAEATAARRWISELRRRTGHRCRHQKLGVLAGAAAAGWAAVRFDARATRAATAGGARGGGGGGATYGTGTRRAATAARRRRRSSSWSSHGADVGSTLTTFETPGGLTTWTRPADGQLVGAHRRVRVAAAAGPGDDDRVWSARSGDWQRRRRRRARARVHHPADVGATGAVYVSAGQQRRQFTLNTASNTSCWAARRRSAANSDDPRSLDGRHARQAQQRWQRPVWQRAGSARKTAASDRHRRGRRAQWAAPCRRSREARSTPPGELRRPGIGNGTTNFAETAGRWSRNASGLAGRIPEPCRQRRWRRGRAGRQRGQRRSARSTVGVGELRRMVAFAGHHTVVGGGSTESGSGIRGANSSEWCRGSGNGSNGGRKRCSSSTTAMNIGRGKVGCRGTVAVVRVSASGRQFNFCSSRALMVTGRSPQRQSGWLQLWRSRDQFAHPSSGRRVQRSR